MRTTLSRLTAEVRPAAARLGRWIERFSHYILLAGAGGIAVGILVYVLEGSGLPSTAGSRSVLVRNIGLVLGGLAALWVAVWRSRVADRQAKATQRQADTAQQRLLDERHQDGAAMLANELLPVRLAGIYALQRLAASQPEEYHIPIMRLLCAFVRRPIRDDLHEPAAQEEDGPPNPLSDHRLREDVQAAIEAISACHERHYISASDAGFNLDLRGADLRFAKLERLNSATGRLGNGNWHSRLPEDVRPRVWRLTTWPTVSDKGAFLLGRRYDRVIARPCATRAQFTQLCKADRRTTGLRIAVGGGPHGGDTHSRES